MATLEFDVVYGEFHPKIRRHLARLLGPDEADDVTQEVFAKVSRGLRHFAGRSSLSTWIYRVATNAAVDRIRSRSSQPAVSVPADEARVPDPAAGTETRLIRREMNACIRDYIERLPLTYRTVIVLSEQRGFTNQQIADALGVSLDTVKIRLHRARARLRAALGEGCSFYRDERNEFACEPRPAPVSFRR